MTLQEARDRFEQRCTPERRAQLEQLVEQAFTAGQITAERRAGFHAEIAFYLDPQVP